MTDVNSEIGDIFYYLYGKEVKDVFGCKLQGGLVL